MLLALCACVPVLTLTLSLLHAAAVPPARAGRKIVQERCRLLATSFAAVLDTELRRYTAEKEQHGWDEPVWIDTANRAAGEGSFYYQVNAFLEKGDSSEVSFEMDEGDEAAPCGDLEIHLRVTDTIDGADGTCKAFRDEITAVHDTDFDSFGSFCYEDREKGTADAEWGNKFIRYQVHADAVSRLDGEICQYGSDYCREDCYQPRYTWHVVNLDSRPANFAQYEPAEGTQDAPVDGVAVFWDPLSREFFRNEDETAVIAPMVWYWDEAVLDEESNVVGYDRHTWTEKVVISYVYCDENGNFHATYRRYMPLETENADCVTDFTRPAIP